MSNIKLSMPLENISWDGNCSQLFGVNPKLYKNFNKAGLHNGVDFFKGGERSGYGDKILAMHNGQIEKIVYDVPHQTKGNGIYLLSEDDSFSSVYWHLSGFDCQIGEIISAGQTIGRLGNSGWVRPLPTKEQPWLGTHIHIGVFKHGLENDYGGFVDPTPWMVSLGDKLPIYFARDLFFGCSGDDVSFLQTCLKLELGEEVDFEPIGFYGPATMKAVIKLQQKFSIFPAIGYCGPKTRRFLIERWSVFPWGAPLGKAFEL